MNLMDSMAAPEAKVELKYCERCGGLWLRSQGTDGAYCSSCEARLRERADQANRQVRGKRNRSRGAGKVGRHRLTKPGSSVNNLVQVDRVPSFAGAEVLA